MLQARGNQTPHKKSAFISVHLRLKPTPAKSRAPQRLPVPTLGHLKESRIRKTSPRHLRQNQVYQSSVSLAFSSLPLIPSIALFFAFSPRLLPPFTTRPLNSAVGCITPAQPILT
jgi:hypothetical protein